MEQRLLAHTAAEIARGGPRLPVRATIGDSKLFWLHQAAREYLSYGEGELKLTCTAGRGVHNARIELELDELLRNADTRQLQPDVARQSSISSISDECLLNIQVD